MVRAGAVRPGADDDEVDARVPLVHDRLGDVRGRPRSRSGPAAATRAIRACTRSIAAPAAAQRLDLVRGLAHPQSATAPGWPAPGPRPAWPHAARAPPRACGSRPRPGRPTRGSMLGHQPVRVLAVGPVEHLEAEPAERRGQRRPGRSSVGTSSTGSPAAGTTRQVSRSAAVAGVAGSGNAGRRRSRSTQPRVEAGGRGGGTRADGLQPVGEVSGTASSARATGYGPGRAAMLLDSASLYFRAFFGVPESATAPGRPTGQRGARLPRHDGLAGPPAPARPGWSPASTWTGGRPGGSRRSRRTRRTGSARRAARWCRTSWPRRCRCCSTCWPRSASPRSGAAATRPTT